MTYRILTRGIEKSFLLVECRRLPTTTGWRAGFIQVSQRYLSIIVTFRDSEEPPPLSSLLSNRAVGRVLLSHCLFPYLLCYGGIKQKGRVKGSTPPLTPRLWSAGSLSLCGSAVGTRPSSLQSARSQPLLSDLFQAPSVHGAHTCPGGPQQKDHGPPSRQQAHQRDRDFSQV